MTIEIFTALLALTLASGTALILPAMGELITEKAGVLNLGVEGMMLIGAVAGVAGTLAFGSGWLGLLTGAIAGAAMSLIFAFITLSLQANQVAAGLALTIFGTGLSAFIGKNYEAASLGKLAIGAVKLPYLSELPVIGPVLFAQNGVVYLALVLFAAITWWLYKTKSGLALRAIGESPEAANAIGYRVLAVRYAAVAFGGLMAGMGGAYLSVCYTPGWVEDMVAGRGWIALALVVFATWRPARVLVGAYLFGGVTQLQLQAQGLGVNIAPELMSALPYIATIVVLVFISRNPNLIKLNAPQSLGQTFSGRG